MIYRVLLLSLTMAMFFSCREDNLVEVELPEAEKKTLTKFGNPEDVTAKEGVFQFPKLAYNYDEFENFIDGRTMELHYSKHFLNYTNKLNELISENRAIQDISLEEVLALPKKEHQDVLNNAGGYYNHKLFFEILSGSKTKVSTSLNEAIVRNFGSFESFKTQFLALANKQFGSSWVWLVYNGKEKKLQITATQNQDNPLMKDAEIKGTPILGLDLWEHAYYLKYNSNRKNYIDKFFDVVNWEVISRKYEKLTPAPITTVVAPSTTKPLVAKPVVSDEIE